MTMTNEIIEIAVKGKWFKVPAVPVDGKHLVRRGKWLKTAYINNEQWLESEVKDPERCVVALKAQGSGGVSADLFTFSQKLPATTPKYSFPLEWDSVAAVHVTSFKDWWESLPQETRKNVRRSQKRGVVVSVKKLDDELIKDLYELNNESAVRQGKVFTHYGKTLEQVARDQVDYLDRSDYICAYSEGELIGVLKLVYRGDVASILTFVPKTSQSDKRPANALIAKAVEICDQKKIPYLTYGMFNYGKKQHTPLREFKIRNGFGEVLVPHYYIPMTTRGTLALKLNLHRGLIGILPHGVITFLVDARAKIYQVFSPSRCSSTPERPNRNRQMERSNPPAGSNDSQPVAHS
jgi:hypothetical protein